MAMPACAATVASSASSSASKGPSALVEHLHHADGAPLVIGHRHAQDRSRAKAGRLVDRLVEARIGVGVGDVHRRARLRHPAGDAFAGLEADGGDGAALRDLRLELRAVVGDEVDRRALGVEELGDLLEQHARAGDRDRASRRALCRARGPRRPSCVSMRSCCSTSRADRGRRGCRPLGVRAHSSPRARKRVVVLAAQMAELVAAAWCGSAGSARRARRPRARGSCDR